MKKRYDPLWEIVGEQVTLQGAEPDVDRHCPHCNVIVHLGPGTKTGERYECGLCGGVSQISEQQEGAALTRVG